MKASWSGFTLVELLVALTIAGAVLVMAHRLFGYVAVAEAALRADRDELDQDQNAGRWLTNTLLSVESGGPLGGFDGGPDRMAFAAWLEQPQGWLELKRIVLRRDGSTLVAGNAQGNHWLLATGVVSDTFDYLLAVGERAQWAPLWVSPVSVPLAVRLRLWRIVRHRLVADTTLYLLKERG